VGHAADHISPKFICFSTRDSAVGTPLNRAFSALEYPPRMTSRQLSHFLLPTGKHGTVANYRVIKGVNSKISYFYFTFQQFSAAAGFAPRPAGRYFSTFGAFTRLSI
jgi:hypothetical protein